MSIRLSETSGRELTRVQRRMLLDRPAVLRIAFALGARNLESLNRRSSDSRGPQIPIRVLAGGMAELSECIVIWASSHADSLKDYDKKRCYKALVEHGIEILAAQLEHVPAGAESVLSIVGLYL